MQAPSVALLRSLRAAASCRPLVAADNKCHLDHGRQRTASTFSYTSQWRRGRNPRTQPKGNAEDIEQYFEDLIAQPASKTVTASRTPAETPSAESLPKTSKEETMQKARIVFGSKLAGPAERKRDIASQSTMIAGVLVPPRPTEPDNCCMSGCVNCVWDVYRDEMEEWASASAEARQRVALQRAREAKDTGGVQADMPAHVANSMDDDGGGSETNWNVGLELSGQKGDLFEGIPVGIREFMKQEKKLKELKRQRSVA